MMDLSLNNFYQLSVTGKPSVGDLGFVSGKINITDNFLTVTGGLTGGGSSSYIVTNGAGGLIRPVPSGGGVSFPVGHRVLIIL